MPRQETLRGVDPGGLREDLTGLDARLCGEELGPPPPPAAHLVGQPRSVSGLHRCHTRGVGQPRGQPARRPPHAGEPVDELGPPPPRTRVRPGNSSILLRSHSPHSLTLQTGLRSRALEAWLSGGRSESLY